MTKTDAIDYLGLQDACREWLERDKNLSIIEFAMDRGHYLDLLDDMAVDCAIAEHDQADDGCEDWGGDLEADIARIANGAIQFLNESGILPKGYGYQCEYFREGYGLLPTLEEGT